MSKDTKPRNTLPQLRFPEFKDGPDWDVPAMSDVYGFRPTNSLSRDQLNYDDGLIYNIHYGDIHTKFQTQFRLEDERVPRVSPAVAEELGDRFYLCQEGDILLADASEDLNDVGKAIELISLDGNRVVAGTHTIHATRLDDKPAIGFGGYLFKSAAVRRGIQKEAQGAKVYGISPTRIAAVPLPMPRTTAEQRKIAECLGSLDDWIAAEAKALAALRRHKTGLMQQLFPRPGETRPRLRFAEFYGAGDWNLEPFDKLYEFKPTNTYSRDQLNYERGTIRNIHYGDIHTRFATHFRVSDEHVPFVNDEVLPEEINPEALCHPGDVIFADASEDLADVGKCIEVIDLSGDRVLSGSHTILARPRADRVVLGFGGYLFKARDARKRIEKEAQGTRVMQISPKRLSSVQVCYPSDSSEQRRIADCLASLDALLAARAEKLAILRDHKRGLMQQLFPATGGTEGGG